MKKKVLIDGDGLPLSIDTASVSPHEVTLIEPLLEKRVLRRQPRWLIYDLAADSDPLHTRLKRRGIELISPHRRNRSKPRTQDGRKHLLATTGRHSIPKKEKGPMIRWSGWVESSNMTLRN